MGLRFLARFVDSIYHFENDCRFQNGYLPYRSFVRDQTSQPVAAVPFVQTQFPGRRRFRNCGASAAKSGVGAAAVNAQPSAVAANDGHGG